MKGATLFLLLVTYLAPLAEIDALLPRHVEFLEEQYAAGAFLLSGRQVPRTGGFILARGERAAVEATVARDPFVRAGAASYQVVEIEPTKATAPLRAALDLA